VGSTIGNDKLFLVSSLSDKNKLTKERIRCTPGSFDREISRLGVDEVHGQLTHSIRYFGVSSILSIFQACIIKCPL
jgi:hypothetical protein